MDTMDTLNIPQSNEEKKTILEKMNIAFSRTGNKLSISNTHYNLMISDNDEDYKQIVDNMVIRSIKTNSKDGLPGKDGKDGLPGKDGKDGKDGLQGINGKDGLPGKDGKDGKDGLQGINGKDGLPGTNGKDGLPGKDGKDGLPGINGKDGIHGTNGKDGIHGTNGKDGLPGTNGKDGLPGTNGKDGLPGKDGKNSVTLIDILLFGELTPRVVTSSSFIQPWKPENVLIPGDNQYWISLTDNKKEEWIMFEFPNNVLVTNLFTIFADGHAGVNTRVEGSTNMTNWDLLHKFDATKFVETSNTFSVYRNEINASSVYRYIRVISEPTSYMNYEYIQFFGKTWV
jgi:hypothetical protein